MKVYTENRGTASFILNIDTSTQFLLKAQLQYSYNIHHEMTHIIYENGHTYKHNLMWAVNHQQLLKYVNL
jgi:hypothetical protein